MFSIFLQYFLHVYSVELLLLKLKNQFKITQLSTYLLIEREPRVLPPCFPDLLHFETLAIIQLFRATNALQNRIYIEHMP